MHERYKGFDPLFYEEVEASEALRELGIIEVLRTPPHGIARFGHAIEWNTALLGLRAIFEEDGLPAHEIRVRNTEDDIPTSFAVDPRDDGTFWVGTVGGNNHEEMVPLNDVQSEGIQALLDQSIDAGLQYPDAIDSGWYEPEF